MTRRREGGLTDTDTHTHTDAAPAPVGRDNERVEALDALLRLHRGLDRACAVRRSIGEPSAGEREGLLRELFRVLIEVRSNLVAADMLAARARAELRSSGPPSRRRRRPAGRRAPSP